MHKLKFKLTFYKTFWLSKIQRLTQLGKTQEAWKRRRSPCFWEDWVTRTQERQMNRFLLSQSPRRTKESFRRYYPLAKDLAMQTGRKPSSLRMLGLGRRLRRGRLLKEKIWCSACSIDRTVNMTYRNERLNITYNKILTAKFAPMREKEKLFTEPVTAAIDACRSIQSYWYYSIPAEI